MAGLSSPPTAPWTIAPSAATSSGSPSPVRAEIGVVKRRWNVGRRVRGVDLVEDAQRARCAGGQIGRHFGPRCGRIGNPDDEIGFLGPAARPADAFLLDRARRLAQPSGIGDDGHVAVEIEANLQHVAGRARLIRYDRHVAPRQRVHEARFADVRGAGEHDAEALAHDLAAAAVVEVGADFLGKTRGRFESARGGGAFNVGFVREVDRGFQQRARLDQADPPAFVELASAPEACRSACRRWASVSASMRSASPSAVVRSSLPLSKARRANSPAVGGTASGYRCQRLERRRENRTPAVDMKLADVLAGLGLGAGEPQHQRVIELLAGRRVAELAQRREARFGAWR